MTFPNPGPASQSTGNVAGGPYGAWYNSAGTALIGPTGQPVSLFTAAGGGGVVLYDGANSITSGTARFSNANGVTFGINGQTITASVTASQSVQTQASGAIAGSGFTTATTAGSVVVGTHDSGGLSLGVPKYITGFTQSNQTGISSIADSAHTQTIGMLSFANSNGITFGLSTGALTATITASAGTVNPGISSIADAAGTQTVGMLSFDNANGVTFGLSTGANTGTITASVNFAGLISNINVSAGTTSSNVSAVTFSNAHGVSFGYDGTNVTGSIATTYAGTGTTFAGTNVSGSMTLNTAGLNMALSGATWAGTGTTFAGANLSGSITQNTAGINLSLSAAAAGVPTPISRMIYPSADLITAQAFTNASLSIQYVSVPVAVTATRLDWLVDMSAQSTTTLATMGIAWSAYAGISTRNVSTLASLSSGSTQTTYTYASNNAGNTELLTAAIRPISVPMNINLTQGEYYVGVNLITITTSIGLSTTSLGLTISLVGPQATSVTGVNYAEMGAVTATSNNLPMGMGMFSALTTGMPTSVALANINATGNNLARANIALVFRNY